MELVVQVQDWNAFTIALGAGVGGVAVSLPRFPEPGWWSMAEAYRAAARERGTKFYLVWDWLAPEKAWPRAMDLLAAVAEVAPDALVLRDPGIWREVRRGFPDLPIHASGNWGCYNSPGLRLAETLGCSRVVLDGPMSLKDLALMRRQSALPLEIVIPPHCQGFAGLCLLTEYLGIDCAACSENWYPPRRPAETLMAALEMLPGLCRLGVEAVQVGGGFFPKDSLGQVAALYQAVSAAPSVEGPRVLAAAREVLAVYGDSWGVELLQKEASPGEPPPEKRAARLDPSPPRPQTGLFTGRGLIWLEARGYQEAADLAREWREPLIIRLTPDNYAAFLPELRRWHPRRLIWRLPPVIRESALSFYQKAVETLRQGGYSRFLAGDWGGVVLVKAAGGEVYGDQTLGIRNAAAVKMAREVGLARICLPPGAKPGDWRELFQAAPAAGFWSYLYHVPALAVGPPEAATRPCRPLGPGAPELHWVAKDDPALLCREVPEHLEDLGAWLQQHGVAPLVVALPRSGLPWGQVPQLSRRPPERHPRRQR